MAEDPTVVLMGEDVDADGGVFKTNIGLPDKFPGRVLATPICENGFMGVALGMSITGMRPVVEIMFADFLPTAGDAIVNQLPKYRYMSGGQFTVPVTVRVMGGGGGRFGTQHSATAESWYMAQPGMRVAAASSPQAAYEMLRAAIRNNDPVLFHEHKALYPRKGLVRRGVIADIGTARVLREGKDVTILGDPADGRALPPGRRDAGRGGHLRGGHRPALNPTHRPADHRGVRAQDRPPGGRRGAVARGRLGRDGHQRAGPDAHDVAGVAARRSACPTTCSSPTARPLEDEMLPSADKHRRRGADAVAMTGSAVGPVERGTPSSARSTERRCASSASRPSPSGRRSHGGSSAAPTR